MTVKYNRSTARYVSYSIIVFRLQALAHVMVVSFDCNCKDLTVSHVKYNVYCLIRRMYSSQLGRRILCGEESFLSWNLGISALTFYHP